MLPVLLDLKILKIYTLGVFLVLALFWGAFWLWRNIKLTSFKEEEIFDGLFVSLFGAFFTSRLVFVLLNFDDFGFNFLKFILMNGYPGLSIIGGLAGGIITFALYARLKNIDFIAAADYFAPAMFLAVAIGKVGSFFSGTDVGSVTSFVLGVTYVGYEKTRHITALYEALFFIIGFAIAQKLLLKTRREQSEKGTAFMYFITFFCFTEFVLDILKGNHLYFAGLSFNMVVSGLVFVFSALYLTVKNRKYIVQTVKNVSYTISEYGKKSIKSIKNTTAGTSDKAS